MVYVPYPRVDLNNHKDLTKWRSMVARKDGDWKQLKIFLEEQSRFMDIHAVPKCWYTELPQGDNYALDVEHFRPKKQASPLNSKQIKKIEKKLGYPIYQAMNKGAYPWLEFDYRNYRLTTALPNRAGAKHVFFPIAKNTVRLNDKDLPWEKSEYPLLLDPTDLHDSQQLVVLPNGLVEPRSKKNVLVAEDFDNIQLNWHSDGMNYLRASITIEMYRLNDDRILIKARKERFKNTSSDLDTLVQAISEKMSDVLKGMLIKPLAESILPSAPFSLASRCAMEAYTIDSSLDALVIETTTNIIKMILHRVEKYNLETKVNWKNP